ncbi:hypothetical protein B7463_g11025, partial [Scytalidium lignicola]
MSNAELASSYAALILADDGVDITAEKLQTLIKAAGVVDVEPIWTSLFAKVRREQGGNAKGEANADTLELGSRGKGC